MKTALLVATIWALPATALGAGPFSSGAVGTVALPFLQTGSGARAMGLGGAFTAAADDASAVYWNPAGLTRLEGKSLLLNDAASQDGVNLGNIAYGVKADRVAWGASLTYMDAGAIERTDAAGSAQGNYHPRDYSAAFSAAADLAFLGAPKGALAAGITGKAFKSQIVEEANGYAFDVGLLGSRKFGADWTARAAAVAQNLGAHVKFDRESDPLPTTFRLGLALEDGENWLVCADAFLPRGNGVQAALGAEYGEKISKRVRGTLRFGVNTQTWSDVSPLSALSMGAGLSFGMISVDYAIGMVGDVSQVQRVTLGFRFGTDSSPARKYSANKIESPSAAKEQLDWIY